MQECFLQTALCCKNTALYIMCWIHVQLKGLDCFFVFASVYVSFYSVLGQDALRTGKEMLIMREGNSHCAALARLQKNALSLAHTH